MPSFFGYMGWSAAILIPIFIVATLLFIVVISGMRGRGSFPPCQGG